MRFFFGWHCLPWDYESLAFISDTDCTALWERALRTLWQTLINSPISPSSADECRFMCLILMFFIFTHGRLHLAAGQPRIAVYRFLIHSALWFLIQMGNFARFGEINANASSHASHKRGESPSRQCPRLETEVACWAEPSLGSRWLWEIAFVGGWASVLLCV